MATSVIRNFIAKALFKKKGAIANSKAVDFSANALEQRLKNIGVDPNAITSENELNQILSYVKQAEDQAFNQSFGNMLGGSKFDRKGEVFDMTGKKLDSSRGTIGGTQIDENTLKQGLMKTDNPFSDLVKTTDQGPKTLAEREAEVLARLEKENKEAAQRIRDRKKLDDPEDMATGGRVGLLAGSVPKVFKFLKNKKKINEAVNNIFPTGDYKYDAQLAADSLVENNPQIFGGKLYEDLDIDTQMEVYGAVIGPIQNSALSVSRMKKATKPEKTLQSMKEGKGINMSDPEIAEEFSRFMKETDPEGYKKLEQTVELSNFKTKDRKGNADGGRIGLRSGLSKAFLEFLKKFKVKQSGDDLKDFLSKRQFMKDIVGNTEKNRKARQLAELKEAMDETRKNPGFEFPSGEELRVDIEKEIAPILLKDRKLNATGGRAGYKFGIGPLIELLTKASKTSPLQFGKNYIKNVREKTLKANETGKFMDLPLAEVGIPATSGAFITQQLKKKLRSMNEDQKEINFENFKKELENDKLYKKYPDLKDKVIERYVEMEFGEKRADGGRIGYKDGTPDEKSLLDFIDVQASGFKTGKNQIEGAPDGITIDSESINAIIKADIPISQKIDLLADYQYGKGRNRIENKDQEIYMDEGGYKNRNVGLGFNQDGEGFSGTVMRNLETGDDDFKIRFKKSFANGGRIGLKAGMTKRAFLKLMGSIGATVGAAKSGIFTGLGKGAGKKVAKEVVQQTTSSMPPPYFFELANKIKTLGKPDKVTYADRVEIHRYTGKNGDEYELIEDLNTGDMKIQKDKMGVGSSGDKTFDTIDDRTEMVFKKGQADETTKSKPADEYEEYKVEFDSDGTAADATELDAAVQKEIIEEATGEAPSIKKASGGIARMLGE